MPALQVDLPQHYPREDRTVGFYSGMIPDVRTDNTLYSKCLYLLWTEWFQCNSKNGKLEYKQYVTSIHERPEDSA